MGRARGKLALKLISDEKCRRLTFAKRNKGLKKKVLELSTLCGVDACMVCLGPNGEVETWPEKSEQVIPIIQRYRNTSKDDREKRQLDISGFIEAKRRKVEEELISRTRKENYDLVYPKWDDRLLNGLSGESLRELGNSLEAKLEKLEERVEWFRAERQRNVNGEEVKVVEMIRETDHQIQLPNYFSEIHTVNSVDQMVHGFHQRVPLLLPAPTDECVSDSLPTMPLMGFSEIHRMNYVDQMENGFHQRVPLLLPAPANEYCVYDSVSTMPLMNLTEIQWAQSTGSISSNPVFEVVENFLLADDEDGEDFNFLNQPQPQPQPLQKAWPPTMAPSSSSQSFMIGFQPAQMGDGFFNSCNSQFADCSFNVGGML